MRGRPVSEARFRDAFKQFGLDFENRSISELKKMQAFQAQLHIWGAENRKWGQGSFETARTSIEHPYFQRNIPMVRSYDKYFKSDVESGLWVARGDADAKHIMYLLNTLESPDFEDNNAPA